MEPAPFSVVAADDHPVVLSGLRWMLKRVKDLRLVAEATTSEGTLAAVEQHAPDLLLLDLWLDGTDGIALLRQVHLRWPSVRILVYSMNDERTVGLRAFRNGASGYLMKSHGVDEVLRALRVVAAGERYVSPELAADLAGVAIGGDLDRAKPPLLAGLSDREMRVLQLIGQGVSTASIAKQLHISAKTVGAHRENLKNKLDLQDGAALARQAVRLVEHQVI